ncbi:MAG: hypothetical protein HRU21_13205, partial [Pseudomonadales bacterium]|nr:hypothetical protein [Pseudomonadales bacterium]
MSEPEGNFNGVNPIAYPTQSIEYLAIEEGSFTIGGVRVQVGFSDILPQNQSSSFFNDQNNFTEQYQFVPFSNIDPFQRTPVVISELQTIKNDIGLFAGSVFDRATEPFLELVQRVPSTASPQSSIEGFEVSLERAEAGTPATINNLSQSEEIAWLAIEVELNTSKSEFTLLDTSGDSIEIKAFTSSQTVNSSNNNVDCDTISLASQSLSNFAPGSSPIYLASQITRAGFNGSWLRRCNSSTNQITLRTEEDVFSDDERAHIDEQVNIIAVSESFVANPAGGPNIVAGGSSIPANSGFITGFSLQPTQVDFSALFGADFVAPPIVVPMTTDQGSDELPTYVRVWNVTEQGFTMAQTVPQGETSPGQSMDVDFLAVVPGEHQLENNIVVIADTLFTTICKGKNAANCTNNGDNLSNATGYQVINFPLINGVNAYQVPPIILAAPQTISNDASLTPPELAPASPFIVASTVNTSATQFKAAFDFAETSLGSPLISNEGLGWIAVSDNLDTVFRAAESALPGDRLINIQTAYSNDAIEG